MSKKDFSEFLKHYDYDKNNVKYQNYEEIGIEIMSIIAQNVKSPEKNFKKANIIAVKSEKEPIIIMDSRKIKDLKKITNGKILGTIKNGNIGKIAIEQKNRTKIGYLLGTKSRQIKEKTENIILLCLIKDHSQSGQILNNGNINYN